MAASAQQGFDIQGHRGARGLAPENTLPGFALALELGVTTLETDLGVTRDGVVVLSHDRRLNPEITRGPDRRWLQAPTPLIYELTWGELQAFDVGRINPHSSYAMRFAHQPAIDGSRIPSLAQLFELGEASRKPPRYNIETKISPLHPDETLPPEEFVARVVDVVRTFGVAARVTIQSFDWRTLLIAKRIAPEIATVALTIDTPEESNLRAEASGTSPWLAGVDASGRHADVVELVHTGGFVVWSPYWRNVDVTLIDRAHELGLLVIPWTVNDAANMTSLTELHVDGLISDYPDLACAVLSKQSSAQRSK